MLYPAIAICIGASAGAIARWQLGMALNAFFPAIPMGTLVANLVGGYLIGFAIPYFEASPLVAPEWRLLFITGFLGALTTFSAFSAETAELLRQGRFGMMCGAMALHVGGSLAMTLLGIGTFALLRR